jgi:hypothetical protein
MRFMRFSVARLDFNNRSAYFNAQQTLAGSADPVGS